MKGTRIGKDNILVIRKIKTNPSQHKKQQQLLHAFINSKMNAELSIIFVLLSKFFFFFLTM